MALNSVDEGLVAGVRSGDRRALAKSITLLESTRSDHRARAHELLNTLLPHTGHGMRLGISGVPGVGKSTFIETLGLALIAKGHRVAVLAIDPSSSLSGGSILGDKTRMEQLSVNEAAYIRPEPGIGHARRRGREDARSDAGVRGRGLRRGDRPRPSASVRARPRSRA